MLLREQVHRGPVLREQALVLQLGVRVTYQTRGELLAKAARLQGAGSTTYSGPDGQRGPYSGVGGGLRAVHQLVKDQTDPPPGFAPQEGPFGAAEGANFVEIGIAVGKTRLGPTGDVPRMLAMVRLKEVVEVRNPRMRRCFNEVSVGCHHHQSQNTRVGAVGYQEVTGFLEYTSKLVTRDQSRCEGNSVSWDGAFD